MPEERIAQLEDRVRELEAIIRTFEYSDRRIFAKHIQLLDGRNISTGTSVGTKIGTSTSDKISFWNATPVAQQANIADADGTLADATTKINSILDVLDNLGITA